VLLGDGGPDCRGGVQGVPDFHFSGLLDEFGQKLVVDAALNEDPSPVGTNFALLGLKKQVQNFKISYLLFICLWTLFKV
jgi:hypothetical protein